jgi:type 1 fimbria pilin
MSIRFLKPHSSIHRVVRLLILCFLAASAQFARADCWYGSQNTYGNAAGNVTIPLLVGNLTAGRDLPIGSLIYRQTYRTGGTLQVTCSFLAMASLDRTFTSTPLPLSSWNGSPYAGKVYETGIPGVGIAVWYAANPLPYSSTVNCIAIGNCTKDFGQGDIALDISLIKIGNIGTGTIDSSKLPTMAISVNKSLTLVNLKFSGSISVTARTCETPNVNVDLGSQALRNLPTVGSGSPWKTFNIALNNCPAFTGTYSNAESGPLYVPGSANNVPGPDRANSIQFQLDPATGVVDSANGVIGLAGTKTATGVGIQIARGGSNSGIQYGALLPSNLTLNTSATSNYNVPLQARYYRTQTNATPGSGNASVTFTINYQ